MTRKIYAVRKRCGQWSVWSDEDMCLNFQSYDEAIETARTAALVLSHDPGETQEERGRPCSCNKVVVCIERSEVREQIIERDLNPVFRFT